MAIFTPPELPPAAPTRSLVGLTDRELVAEVRRGSDRAFEQLYERYYRRIAAFVYGMVGDYGRAEDLSQDVFMSALRRIRETERSIAFKPWIYEIAKNACIDQFRRTRRTQEVSYDTEEGLGAADYGRLVTLAPTPDVAVEEKMAIDHLRGAFGGLSQTHHEILVMREFEGLSYREIGERLGMSRPSVESTLFRARRRLGEEYEELVSGERCLRVQGIIAAADAAAPGAKDQRRLAAHLSHCQSCRRHATLAGMDAAALVVARSARAKIAALIPLPAFLRRRGGLGEELVPVAANHRLSTLAQLSTQLSSSVDPAIASWPRAVAAAATLAIAGMAGGAAVNHVSRTSPGGSGAEASRAVAPRAQTPAAKPAAPAVPVTPTPTPATSSDRGGRAAAPAPAGPQPAAPGAVTPTGVTGGAAAPLPGALPAPFAPGAQPVLGGLDPSTSATSGGRLSAGAEAPAILGAAAAVAAAAAAASSSAATRTQLEGAASAAAAAASAAADAAARAAAVVAAAKAIAAATAAAEVAASDSTATKTQIESAASAAAATAAAAAAADAAQAAAGSALGG